MSTPPISGNRRLPGLDGLRGVACLMVFLYHLRWAAQPNDANPLPLMIRSFDVEFLLRKFDIGVAIFFVLSGLLLSLPFWRAILENQPLPAIGRYLWRRGCRIVPAYFAVLIAVYLLRGGTYTWYGALDFLLHATFLHNFADYAYLSLHPDLWTIGIEFQFYLLLPIIMKLVAVTHRRCGGIFTLGVLVSACLLADIAAAAALRMLEPAISDRFLSPNGPVIGGTVFSYLKLFAFGIAAAYAVLKVRISPRAADVTCGVGLLATATLVLFGHEAGWRQSGGFGWPLNGAILGLVAASLARSSMFSRLFATKWIAATGAISYGIYLWHDLVLRAVFSGTLRDNLSGFPIFLAGGGIALLVTITIASLSWRFIERDAIRAPYPLVR